MAGAGDSGDGNAGDGEPNTGRKEEGCDACGTVSGGGGARFVVGPCSAVFHLWDRQQQRNADHPCALPYRRAMHSLYGEATA